MAKVTEKSADNRERPLFMCDFSPPRGPDLGYVERAKALSADFICIGYNPGKSVRVDSATVAYTIKQHTDKDVVFNLVTRDMNKLAMQSHLLGAAVLGLENLVIIKGDEFTERDLSMVKDVGDFTPTALIRAIKEMNQGVDYRGLKLRSPTDFCVGATIDLSKGLEVEARLAQKKALAGADYFLMQSIYDAGLARQFLELYLELHGQELSQPIFYGIQVLVSEGIIFGDVPESIKEDLEKGRDGAEIAIELIRTFIDSGLKSIYLIPPILRGGARDYEAAQRVLEGFR